PVRPVADRHRRGHRCRALSAHVGRPQDEGRPASVGSRIRPWASVFVVGSNVAKREEPPLLGAALPLSWPARVRRAFGTVPSANATRANPSRGQEPRPCRSYGADDNETLDHLLSAVDDTKYVTVIRSFWQPHFSP